MKKVFAAVLCLICLSGCGSSDSDLPERILEELNELAAMEPLSGSNRTKRRYSYYLPKGMGQRDANELSEVLMKDGYRVIMNFDPGAIVIKEYYSDEAQEPRDPENNTSEKTDMRENQEALGHKEDSQSDAQSENSSEEKSAGEYTEPISLEVSVEKKTDGLYFSGVYQNEQKEYHPYTLRMISGDKAYLLYLNGSYVKLYSVVPRAEVPSMLKAMFTLMRSVRYEEEEILKAYSLKSLTQTKKETLDYLEQHLPSSGSLQELLSGDDTQGDSEP